MNIDELCMLFTLQITQMEVRWCEVHMDNQRHL